MKSRITTLLLFISLAVTSQVSFRLNPIYYSPVVQEESNGSYSLGAGIGFEPHDHIYLSVDFNCNFPMLGLNSTGMFFDIENEDGDRVADGYGSVKSLGVYYKSIYTTNANDDNSFYLGSGLAIKRVARYIEVEDSDSWSNTYVPNGKYTSSQVVVPLSYYTGYKAATDEFFSDLYFGVGINLLAGGEWSNPLEGEYTSSAELSKVSVIFGLSYCFGKS